MRTEANRESAECSTRTSPRHTPGLSREQAAPDSNSSNEAAQPSHYLYVPNTAGRDKALLKLHHKWAVHSEVSWAIKSSVFNIIYTHLKFAFAY